MNFRENLIFNNNNLLLLLILTDVVFLLFHIFLNQGLLTNTLFSIEVDRGFSEFFQYIKEFWIAVLLMLMALVKKRWLYFFWSVLFVLFLIDDSMSIHEFIGFQLDNLLNFHASFGLRSRDFGELLVYLVIASALLPIIITFYYSPPSAKIFSIALSMLVFILIIFGIVFDMLAIMLNSPFLSFAEDLGEMFVMSVILWFVYNQSA